jgi:hypothetical protein
VFGWIPSRSAAFPLPLIRQSHFSSTFCMWVRRTTSRLVASTCPSSPGAGRQRRIETQRVASGSDHGPLDHVLEFPDVAWPVVLLQLIDE